MDQTGNSPSKHLVSQSVRLRFQIPASVRAVKTDLCDRLRQSGMLVSPVAADSERAEEPVLWVSRPSRPTVLEKAATGIHRKLKMPLTKQKHYGLPLGYKLLCYKLSHSSHMAKYI